MVEELKAEMRKLENLIGFEGKVDVTSRAFTQELIRSLDSKYKDDVKNSIRLHQLEFYHDLIESARYKQRKSAEVEEKFLLEKKREKKDDEDEEEEVEETVKEKELFKKPEESVAIKAENVDEWKDLMTLSRLYYVLEHPNSTGLTWKRRISKKKSISKFSDKDLIEWRVAENFKLRGLEEWALSRSEARKVAEKSPYDFDDLLEDDESRELEDMFNILDTQKQQKRKVGQLEKSLKSNRPFKFKDEGIEDWTESYSDDSEESGVEDMAEEILEIDEEPDFKVDDYKVSSEEQSINEEETISEIFSVYEEKPKFRNPVFEEMDKAETMERWFDLCHEAVEVPAATIPERPPAPQILFTIEEGDDEEFLETEIPDNIGYIRGQKVALKEAKEKDIERPGGRIPVKEVQERDIERPGDDSEEPPILAPYTGERMRIKEAKEKNIERLGGRIPAKEATEKDIEKLAGKVPEPNAKDFGKTEPDSEEDAGKLQETAENRGAKKVKEKDIERKLDFSKLPSSKSIDKLFDDMDALEEGFVSSDAEEGEEQVTSSERGSISKQDEEIIEEHIKKMTKEGKDYALSDAKNEAVYKIPGKVSSMSSERRERTLSKEHDELLDHSPDKDKLKRKDMAKEQVTSSERGSISKQDEEVIEEHIKKMTKEGKDYALSDAKNEAVYKIPGKVSSMSSERQATKLKPVTSSEKHASKHATPSQTQAARKKSFTTPETPATKKKSSSSSEKPAAKKAYAVSSEKLVTKKKSATSSETQATKRKSLTTPQVPATKKKSATSSEKLVTKKKSPIPSKRQSTRHDMIKTVQKDEQPSSYEMNDLESLLKKGSNISSFEIDPSGRNEKSESSKPKVNQEATKDVIRRMFKEAKSSASNILQEPISEKSISSSKLVNKPEKDLQVSLNRESKSDLETLLKIESDTGSDSLGEFDLDDTNSRKASKTPSTHQATISMQDEQRVGERLKSILEESKVDALDEKEKQYKKRRATLLRDDSDAPDPDLEAILKSESSLNVTKSGTVKGEEPPKFGKTKDQAGTVGLGQEDIVEKVVKSTIKDAKPTALRRQASGSSEGNRKGSSEAPPILVPYTGERKRIKEAKEKDIQRPDGRIPEKEATGKGIENLSGKIPEPNGKDVDFGKKEPGSEWKTGKLQETAEDKGVKKLPENIPVKEVKEKDLQPKVNFSKLPSKSIDKLFDDKDAIEEGFVSSDAEEGKKQVTSSERGSISKQDEEAIHEHIKKMTKEGKDYAMSDAKNEAVYKIPSKVSSMPSKRPERKLSKEHDELRDHSPDIDTLTSKHIAKELVTSSEKGSISKQDEEVIEEHSKKMAKEGKAYALSDVKNEAIYKIPSKVSSRSSERPERKPSKEHVALPDHSPDIDKLKSKDMAKEQVTSSERGSISKQDEEAIEEHIKKMTKQGKDYALSDVKNEAIYKIPSKVSSRSSDRPERKPSNDHDELLDHSPDLDKIKSKDMAKEQVTSSGRGSISKQDEEAIEEHVKKMTKQGKDYTLSDVKNEAIYKIPSKVSSRSSERPERKPIKEHVALPDHSPDIDKLKKKYMTKEQVTSSERGSISKHDEEVIEEHIKKMTKEGKGYELSDAKNAAVYKIPSKVSSRSSERPERKLSKEHDELRDHSPDIDTLTSKHIAKEQVTSSEKGSISKQDEEVTEENIKKMAKEGKAYALSDVKNEAIYKIPSKVSSRSSERPERKPSKEHVALPDHSPDIDKLKSKDMAKEQVTSSERGSISKQDEEAIEEHIKKMTKQGKDYALSDVKNEAIYKIPSKVSSRSSDRPERKPSNDHDELLDHSPDLDKIKSKDMAKEQVTSSGRGSISKQDEEAIEEHIKKMTKQGKDYALSDVKNEAIYKIPSKVSSRSSERPERKPIKEHVALPDHSPDIDKLKKKYMTKEQVTSSERGSISKHDEEVIEEHIKKMTKEGKGYELSDAKNAAVYKIPSKVSSRSSERPERKLSKEHDELRDHSPDIDTLTSKHIAKEQVTSSEKGSICKQDEEVIEENIKKMAKEGKAYALSDAKNEAIYKIPSKVSSRSSERLERKPSKEHVALPDHSPDIDKLKSNDMAKEQVTSSERGSISKQDEEAIEEHIKKMTKQGKDYALSDVKNEAIYKIPSKVSSRSSDRPERKPSNDHDELLDHSPDLDKIKSKDMAKEQVTSSGRGSISKQDEEAIEEHIKKMTKQGKDYALSDVKNEAIYKIPSKVSSRSSERPERKPIKEHVALPDHSPDIDKLKKKYMTKEQVTSSERGSISKQDEEVIEEHIKKMTKEGKGYALSDAKNAAVYKTPGKVSPMSFERQATKLKPETSSEKHANKQATASQTQAAEKKSFTTSVSKEHDELRYHSPDIDKLKSKDMAKKQVTSSERGSISQQEEEAIEEHIQKMTKEGMAYALSDAKNVAVYETPGKVSSMSSERPERKPSKEHDELRDHLPDINKLKSKDMTKEQVNSSERGSISKQDEEVIEEHIKKMTKEGKDYALSDSKNAAVYQTPGKVSSMSFERQATKLKPETSSEKHANKQGTASQTQAAEKKSFTTSISKEHDELRYHSPDIDKLKSKDMAKKQVTSSERGSISKRDEEAIEEHIKKMTKEGTPYALSDAKNAAVYKTPGKVSSMSFEKEDTKLKPVTSSEKHASKQITPSQTKAAEKKSFTFSVSKEHDKLRYHSPDIDTLKSKDMAKELVTSSEKGSISKQDEEVIEEHIKKMTKEGKDYALSDSKNAAVYQTPGKVSSISFEKEDTKLKPVTSSEKHASKQATPSQTKAAEKKSFTTSVSKEHDKLRYHSPDIDKLKSKDMAKELVTSSEKGSISKQDEEVIEEHIKKMTKEGKDYALSDSKNAAVYQTPGKVSSISFEKEDTKLKSVTSSEKHAGKQATPSQTKAAEKKSFTTSVSKEYDKLRYHSPDIDKLKSKDMAKELVTSSEKGSISKQDEEVIEEHIKKMTKEGKDYALSVSKNAAVYQTPGKVSSISFEKEDTKLKPVTSSEKHASKQATPSQTKAAEKKSFTTSVSKEHDELRYHSPDIDKLKSKDMAKELETSSEKGSISKQNEEVIEEHIKKMTKEGKDYALSDSKNAAVYQTPGKLSSISFKKEDTKLKPVTSSEKHASKQATPSQTKAAEKKSFTTSVSKEHDELRYHSLDIDKLKSKDMAKELVTSSEKGSISKQDEEAIEEHMKKMTKQGKDYALSDVKNEAIFKIPSKVSSRSSERPERKPSKEHVALPDHSPDIDKLTSKDMTKEQVTSSERGSISKQDEEVIEKHIKKMTKEGKGYALSDAKNEAIYKIPSNVSSISSKRQATKLKPVTSSEKPANKQASPFQTQAARKKSFTHPETPMKKKKSSSSFEKPAAKRPPAVSSEKPVTKKKSPTPFKRQSTKHDMINTVQKDEQPSSNISSFEIDPSGRKEKSESIKPKTNQEAKKGVIRRMFKEAKSSASNILQEAVSEISISSSKLVNKPSKDLKDSLKKESQSDLDTLLKSESDTGSDSLGEFDLDDTNSRKASKTPSTHQATISMQVEQRVGERLKSILEESKVDALEEKEKEYKKRRATLLRDDTDAPGPYLEAILKSESNLNVTKSGNVKVEEPPKFGKTKDQPGTVGLGQEDRVEKVVKSLIKEAKPTALRRQASGSSERTKKGSKDSFRKSK